MCGGSWNSLISALVLAGEQPAVRAVEVKAIPKPMLLCWHCKSEVLPEYSWCPACGSALKPVSCSYCGQMIGAQENNCPYCGAPKRMVRY